VQMVFGDHAWGTPDEHEDVDLSSEQAGQDFLRRAMRMEKCGHAEAAMAAYADIAGRFASTSIGRDAQISLDALRLRVTQGAAGPAKKAD
jgi:hypothetical protein